MEMRCAACVDVPIRPAGVELSFARVDVPIKPAVCVFLFLFIDWLWSPRNIILYFFSNIILIETHSWRVLFVRKKLLREATVQRVRQQATVDLLANETDGA